MLARTAPQPLTTSGTPSCVLQGGNYGALEPLPRQGGSEIRLLVSQNELSCARELYEAFFVSNQAAPQEGEDISAGVQEQEETNGQGE
jgi:hypothetical protein